jgi:hypothetical protein
MYVCSFEYVDQNQTLACAEYKNTLIVTRMLI